MAKFNEKMRDNINASIADRPAPPGSSGAPRPAGSPPPAAHKFDGRRRLDAAGMIRLDRIIPDADQPRTEFDAAELERLAESLKARGQLQPIRVRYDAQVDRYIVIAGERRYRAALLAGLESIACIEADAASPEDILEDQLVENALRSDLKPVEQAHAYRRLLTARNLTHRQLAERLHVGHASIARALALLDLPELIQAKVESGAIAANTAYELSKVDDPGEQAELAREAEAGRLKRDQLKERTRTPRAPKLSIPDAAADRRTFRLASGASVVVAHPEGLDDGRLAGALRDALAVAEGEKADDPLNR